MNPPPLTLSAAAFAGKHAHLLGMDDPEAQATMQVLAAAGATCVNCAGTAYDDHLAGVDVIVVSPQIAASPTQYPEVQAARQRGIPVIAWPVLMGGFLADRCVFAVAGTRHRRGVAALLGHVLTEAGLDPTCFMTTPTSAVARRARIGGGAIGITEADERYESFLSLSPRVAIITGINRRDRRYFADMGELQRAFNAFVAGIDLYTAWETPPTLILNWDDPGCRALHARSATWPGRILCYGLETPADYQAVALRDDDGVSFVVRTTDGDLAGAARLPRGAEHLGGDALATFVAAQVAGVPPAMIQDALASFWLTNAPAEFAADVGAGGILPVTGAEDAPGDYAIEFLDGSGSLGSFEPTLFTAVGNAAQRITIEQTRMALSETMDARGEPQPAHPSNMGPTADADPSTSMRQTARRNARAAAARRRSRWVNWSVMTLGLGLSGLCLWLARRQLADIGTKLFPLWSWRRSWRRRVWQRLTLTR